MQQDATSRWEDWQQAPNAHAGIRNDVKNDSKTLIRNIVRCLIHRDCDHVHECRMESHLK